MFDRISELSNNEVKPKAKTVSINLYVYVYTILFALDDYCLLLTIHYNLSHFLSSIEFSISRRSMGGVYL